MKTNVTMIRPMGQYEVKQRTQDGMFDANHLLNQWNKSHDSQRRKMSEFLESQSTIEFLQVLDYEVSRNSTNADNQLVNKSVYHINKHKTQSNGQKEIDNVWMHPYLFIDFAMWINPKFKLDVIKFVYDQLIKFRHDAGDNYKGLTSAVQKFNNVNYPQLAKGLNYCVFGTHQEGLRQQANESQLRDLTDLQKKLAFACDMGYINSFDQLIIELRKIYHARNNQIML